MFDQGFVNYRGRTRKPWTVGFSLALQAGLVAVLLILPLLHPEAPHLRLETPVRVMFEVLTTRTPRATQPIERFVSAAARPVFTAPARIPTHISQTPVLETGALPDLPIAAPGSLSGDSPIRAFVAELPVSLASLPPSVKPGPAPRPEPIHVGLVVQSAKLIFGPKPHYSAVAIAAHMQGTVKLQAIIAADGAIRNLRVMSGPALLAGSALDAVKQWRYQPTLLNGVPVEVITEIDVVFTLNGN